VKWLVIKDARYEELLHKLPIEARRMFWRFYWGPWRYTKTRYWEVPGFFEKVMRCELVSPNSHSKNLVRLAELKRIFKGSLK